METNDSRLFAACAVLIGIRRRGVRFPDADEVKRTEGAICDFLSKASCPWKKKKVEAVRTARELCCKLYRGVDECTVTDRPRVIAYVAAHNTFREAMMELLGHDDYVFPKPLIDSVVLDRAKSLAATGRRI